MGFDSCYLFLVLLRAAQEKLLPGRLQPHQMSGNLYGVVEDVSLVRDETGNFEGQLAIGYSFKGGLNRVKVTSDRAITLMLPLYSSLR